MGIIRSKIFTGIGGNIWIKIILKYKMLNLDNIVSNKNENKDNDCPFRMLIIGPSGSGKTNVFLHLIIYTLLIQYIYTLRTCTNQSTNS